MLEFFRALQNTTCWAMLGLFVVALIGWKRRSAPAPLRGTLDTVLPWWWLRAFRKTDSPPESRGPSRFIPNALIALLAVGSIWNLAFSVYEGYAVPRDIMQDIVSAQELLADWSPYPHDMTQRIGIALEREPPRFSLVSWSPALLEKEREARRDAAGSDWVQAHPPGMTLLMVPLVALGGVQGSYLAFCLLSLAALLVGLHLLERGLELELTGRQKLVLSLLVVGWFPALGVFRNGQTGLVLGTLLIVCWYSLKRDRPIWAGVAAGLATCIKLYPGAVLIYLLVRHRRAFVAGSLTLALLLCLPLPFFGLTPYQDHFDTAHNVVEQYAAYPTNVGWLGMLARLSGALPGQLGIGRPLWLALGLVVVCAACLLVRRKPASSSSTAGAEENEGLDLEFSLFVVLTVALSPIAWYHYLPVLLMPLAVLGQQVFRRTTSPAAVLGFTGLLLALAVPDPAFLRTSICWKDMSPGTGAASC